MHAVRHVGKWRITIVVRNHTQPSERHPNAGSTLGRLADARDAGDAGFVRREEATHRQTVCVGPQASGVLPPPCSGSSVGWLVGRSVGRSDGWSVGRSVG